jgi:hypothetical protein
MPWIKNQVMEFIFGIADGALKEIFKTTIEMDMVSYMMESQSSIIEGFGKMGNKPTRKW